MVIKYIEKLRSGSDNEKKRFLVISTSIVLALIVAVWAVYGFSLVPDEARLTATKTEKGEGVFSKFFEEASRDLTKVREDVTDVWANFFEGKYDPEEIPADLEGLTTDIPENPSLTLPKTD